MFFFTKCLDTLEVSKSGDVNDSLNQFETDYLILFIELFKLQTLFAVYIKATLWILF